jgi:hypothetical protein
LSKQKIWAPCFCLINSPEGPGNVWNNEV